MLRVASTNKPSIYASYTERKPYLAKVRMELIDKLVSIYKAHQHKQLSPIDSLKYGIEFELHIYNKKADENGDVSNLELSFKTPLTQYGRKGLDFQIFDECGMSMVELVPNEPYDEFLSGA